MNILTTRPFIICLEQHKISREQIEKIDLLIEKIDLFKSNAANKLSLPLNLSDILILSAKIYEKTDLKLRKDAAVILFSAICNNKAILQEYNSSTLEKSQSVIKRILQEFVNQDDSEYKLEIKNFEFRVVNSNNKAQDSYPITDIDQFANLCHQMDKICHELNNNETGNYELLKDIEEKINKVELSSLISFFKYNSDILAQLIGAKRLQDIKKLYSIKKEELERLKKNAFLNKKDVKNFYFMNIQTPLEKIMKRLDHIATLPQMFQKIKNMIDDEKSSVRDIAEAMEQDPAYASGAIRKIKNNIIIMSKSIIYNPGGRKINDFADALLSVGIDVLYGIIHLIPVFDHSRSQKFNLSRLWIHSFKTALATKYLALKYNCDEPISFTLGTIHDIGKIFLMQSLPEEYTKVVERINNEIKINHELKESVENSGLISPYIRVFEKEVIGLDHSEVGKLICDTWNFYPRYGDIIGNHHSPNINDKLAFLLYLADMTDIAADFDCSCPPWVNGDWKEDLERYMGQNLIMIKKWIDVFE